MAKKRKAAAKADGTIDASKYDYQTLKVQGRDGKTRHSIGNGDAVQRAMAKYVANAKDTKVALAKVVKDNKLGDKVDVAKWDNMGLLRMTIGNSLRALVKNGTPVTIGDETVKTLAQRIAVDTVKDKPVRKAKAAAEAEAA